MDLSVRSLRKKRCGFHDKSRVQSLIPCSNLECTTTDIDIGMNHWRSLIANKNCMTDNLPCPESELVAVLITTTLTSVNLLLCNLSILKEYSRGVCLLIMGILRVIFDIICKALFQAHTQTVITRSPAYNEHPATTSNFFSQKTLLFDNE